MTPERGRHMDPVTTTFRNMVTPFRIRDKNIYYFLLPYWNRVGTGSEQGQKQGYSYSNHRVNGVFRDFRNMCSFLAESESVHSRAELPVTPFRQPVFGVVTPATHSPRSENHERHC